MATIDNLNIQITSDSKKAVQGIDSLIKRLDVLSAKLRGTNLASSNAFKNMNISSEKLKKSFETVSNSMDKLSRGSVRNISSINKYAFSFASLYARIRLAVRAFEFLQQSVKSTSDYIETYNFYNVSFGKIANEWSKDWEKYGYNNAEDYANSFTERLNADFEKLSGVKIEMFEDGSGLLASTGLKNLGLNIQEITQYGAQLASVTNAVGQTGETSLAVARTFTKLAGDVSSLFNVDYSNVANNIQSVLQGQSRAGYKYGWDTTLATLQQYADALDLSKAVSEMSQMEKQQLRILAILEQSKVAWGDLANTINSPSNMMRQFKNNFSEVSLVLGQLFIPILQKVMPILNGATIAIKRLLINIANLMGIKLDLDAFGQGFSDMEDGAEDFADGLDDATDSAKKLNRQLSKFDELNNLTSSSGVSGSLEDLGNTIDLTEEIIKATEEYETAWAKAYEKMQNDAEDFANRFEKTFKRIRDFFKPITDPFKDLDWETITKNITDFGNAIAPYAENFGKGFIEFFGDLSEISANTIEVLFGKNGAITHFTEWLNKNDPQKAERLGYSFGVLTAGLIGLSALKKLSGLGTVLSKSSSGLSSLASALALFIPLETFFQTKTESGAVKYLESLEKVNSFDFGNMKLPDWWNTLKELAMSSVGLSGKKLASNTLLTSVPIPNKEDFETLEEYQAAIEEYRNTVAEIAYGKDLEDRIMDNALVRTLLSKTLYRQLSKDATGEVVKSFEEMEQPINNILDNFTDKLKEMRDLIPSFSFGTGFFVKPTLKGYSTGGFPEDGLFMANHNELVGQFSNGKTAVANNGQITQGISDAVYPAVYNAVVSAMSNSNTGNGNVTVEIDGREVFRTVQDYSSRYSNRTGRPAFI